jgi:hypothetical protein
MADITITAANIGCGSNALVRRVTGGEAIAHGQPVYQQSNGKFYLADANVSEQTAEVQGISFCSCSGDGVDFFILFFGDMKFGAILTKGETYILSSASGKICPIGDLASGWWVTKLGSASDTSTLKVNIEATRIQK